MQNPATAVEELARAFANLVDCLTSQATPAVAAPISWRERLHACNPDTRLGVEEVAEALGKSKHWVYKQVQRKEIPHSKFEGALVFRALDIRRWAASREVPIVRPDLSPSRAGGAR